MGFIDKVFGSAGGNDDLRYGHAKSKKIRRAGANRYTKLANQALDDSKSYIEPYYQQGMDANKTFLDLIGEGDSQAQKTYFDNFVNDPGFQASLNKGLESVEKSAASRGNLHSGRTRMALFDHGQSAQYGAFQDRLNRLERLRQNGQQAGNQLSQLTYATGNNLADLENMLAQQEAASFTGLQNQIASSRGSGFQNALNLGATAVKALSGLPPI